VATKHNKRMSWNMNELNLTPPPGDPKKDK
jgi:hypothetical protein